MTLAGFPHSDISGSTLLCSSPERFAAYASFIGSLSLGIRRTPLVAYFVKQHLSSARCINLQTQYVTFKELVRWPPRCLAARGNDTRAQLESQAPEGVSEVFPGSPRPPARTVRLVVWEFMLFNAEFRLTVSWLRARFCALHSNTVNSER